jgi:hypothetical protein
LISAADTHFRPKRGKLYPLDHNVGDEHERLANGDIGDVFGLGTRADA